MNTAETDKLIAQIAADKARYLTLITDLPFGTTPEGYIRTRMEKLHPAIVVTSVTKNEAGSGFDVAWSLVDPTPELVYVLAAAGLDFTVSDLQNNPHFVDAIAAGVARHAADTAEAARRMRPAPTIPLGPSRDMPISTWVGWLRTVDAPEALVEAAERACGLGPRRNPADLFASPPPSMVEPAPLPDDHEPLTEEEQATLGVDMYLCREVKAEDIRVGDIIMSPPGYGARVIDVTKTDESVMFSLSQRKWTSPPIPKSRFPMRIQPREAVAWILNRRQKARAITLDDPVGGGWAYGADGLRALTREEFDAKWEGRDDEVVKAKDTRPASVEGVWTPPRVATHEEMRATFAQNIESMETNPKDWTPALSFSERVDQWVVECFGAQIARDLTERNHRFLEESLELVQACGCTQEEALQLVTYVYGRPAGVPQQETGGVLVTLAALCLAQGIDMEAAGDAEMVRVWDKIPQIREKQARKPKHGPLPGPDVQSGDQNRPRMFEPTDPPMPSFLANLQIDRPRVRALLEAVRKDPDALYASERPPGATGLPIGFEPDFVMVRRAGDIELVRVGHDGETWTVMLRNFTDARHPTLSLKHVPALPPSGAYRTACALLGYWRLADALDAADVWLLTNEVSDVGDWECGR